MASQIWLSEGDEGVRHRLTRRAGPGLWETAWCLIVGGRHVFASLDGARSVIRPKRRRPPAVRIVSGGLPSLGNR